MLFEIFSWNTISIFLSYNIDALKYWTFLFLNLLKVVPANKDVFSVTLSISFFLKNDELK